jgi:outer membrane protein TolC
MMPRSPGSDPASATGRRTPHRLLAAAAFLVLLTPVLSWAADAPLTLTAAVDYTLKNNPDLQAARQDPASAAARLDAARAAGRLTTSANGFATAGTGNMVVAGVTPVMPQYLSNQLVGRQATLNGTVMYPLSTGGRVGADTRQKAHELSSAQDLLRAAENDLTYTVRVAYKKTALALMIVDIQQQRVTETEERLRVDQDKYDAGKVPLVTVLRDKAELADARQGLTNARRDVEIALLDLKLEMGAPLATNTTLADKLAYEPFTEDLPALVKEADAKRPEIASAKALVAAAQDAISSADSAYNPQLALAGMGNLTQNSNVGRFGEYQVGLIASIPLSDGGLRSAQVREAQAKAVQARRELDSQRLKADRDVRVAYANLSAADQNTRASMEAVAQAEEEHRVAKLRYDAGKGILLEVLDSLTALVRAKVNYSQALYDYSTARDDLDRAVGRG